METKPCLFCEIAKGNQPSELVWENEEFLAIVNKYPVAPVHLLVIPKDHVSKTDLVENGKNGFWEALMKAVVEVIKLKGLDKTGYKFVNNGAGYNHFDHEHMHILGGTKSEPAGKT